MSVISVIVKTLEIDRVVPQKQHSCMNSRKLREMITAVLCQQLLAPIMCTLCPLNVTASICACCLFIVSC